MVAFVTSLVITLALTLVVIPFARRRPVGAPLSWGEAMVAATYVFGVAFLAYGVVPHQWLTLADNAWNWRSDRLLLGPGDVLDKLPFTITYETLRDIIVVGIYVVFLGLQLFLWSFWQKRGQVKAPAIGASTSTYGRPLVRRG